MSQLFSGKDKQRICTLNRGTTWDIRSLGIALYRSQSHYRVMKKDFFLSLSFRQQPIFMDISPQSLYLRLP